MRLYIILFFSAMLMFTACSDTNKVPKEFIQREEMVNLLMDVHIVDGSMNNIVQLPDTMYKYGTIRYLELFKRYHTDSSQFRRSLRFYTTRPEMLQDMYDEVQKKIAARSDSLYKLQNQAQGNGANVGSRPLPGKPQPANQPTPATNNQPPANKPPVNNNQPPAKPTPANKNAVPQK